MDTRTMPLQIFAPVMEDLNLQITFRKATLTDVDTLVEQRLNFVLELAGVESHEKTDALKRQLQIFFSKAVARNTSISIIATCNNETAGIGTIHFRKIPGNLQNPSGKWGYIMNMYTVPEFRRKGICKTILNSLIAEGKKLGVTAFELHASIDGEPVYLKNEFKLHHEPTLRKLLP